MTPDTFEREELGAELNNARKYAVSFIAAALGLGVLISEVKRISELSNPQILDYCYICLLLEIGALVFIWIWATEKELALLRRWLYPKAYDPPSSLKETTLIMSIAIVVVCLFYTAKAPLLFGIAFVTYSALALVATAYLTRELRHAFADSEAHLKASTSDPEDLRNLRLNGMNILADYYLRKPHVGRYYVALLLSILGLACAVTSLFTRHELLAEAAYAVYILTIIIVETIIANWRNRRDLRIRELNSQMRVRLADGAAPPRPSRKRRRHSN